MTEHQPVVAAIAAVMEDVRAVRKSGHNPQQNYQFRGIDATVNAVGPALRKHGVVVVPLLEDATYRDVTTSTGKPSRECTVRVRYRFHGPAGDYIDCVTPGESMDFGDKGAPKAMSVAMRIALLQALCLPTDDVDADAQNYERASRNGHHETDASPDVPTADQAREQLRNVCAAMELDPATVAAYYADRIGTNLKEETDGEAITKYVAAIRDGRVKIPAAGQDAA